jgi:hypothetical protein
MLGLLGGAWLLSSSAQEERKRPQLAAPPLPGAQAAAAHEKPDSPQRHCILVWLSGGPSQIDTFDPKEGNIALFKAIDTNVKGLRFSETLPLLAKQANHLAILRGVKHRDPDHGRGAYLMQTGVAPGGVDYPSVGCVLAKELGHDAPRMPRLVRIGSEPPIGPPIGPGFLAPRYGPLVVSGDKVPPADDFEKFQLDKDKVQAMRDKLTTVLDVSGEKAELRDAYGRGRFGSNCLLARRMVENGVAVVEITLGGWDTHANAADATRKVGAHLDAGLGRFVVLLLRPIDGRILRLAQRRGPFGSQPRIEQR